MYQPQSTQANLFKKIRNLQKKIQNLDQWTNAFVIFMYVYLKAHSNKLFELLSYFNNIRHSAARYTFAQAQLYDTQFRLRKAINPGSSWAKVGTQLFLFKMPQIYNHNVPRLNNRQFVIVIIMLIIL